MYAPQLLANDHIINTVRHLGGLTDNNGFCAFVWLLRSKTVDDINFDADGFRELF